MFVYEGSGCTGAAALPRYEAMMGRKVDGAADFLDDTSTWANLLSAASWAANCWKGQVANLSLGVPMGVVQGGSTQLADIAAGKDDTYYKSIAQTLVQAGFSGAYLRVGWEFNGNWYIWSASGKTATWISAYRHIVTVMRGVAGSRFKFVWNPALYTQQVDPGTVYPGDAYVDVVGVDAYDTNWDVGYANPYTRWASIENDKWGVADFVAFAKAHDKPLAFPEWGAGTRSDGHGGDDDPFYIANMAATMASANVAYQSYWDYDASDFNGFVSGGQYPATMAALMIRFGTSTAGQTSSLPLQQNVGKIVMGHGASFTATPLPVTATGCYLAAIQNGPTHYELIPWNTAGAGACVIGWGKSTDAANLYRPDMGSSPAAALGAVSGLTTDVGVGMPVIIAVNF